MQEKKDLSVIKKLAGQTAIYGLSTIVGRFINYLLVPIQTRVFNQAQFGIISGLFAYITFLNVLLTHGMETAFFRFAEKKNHENAVYSTSLKSVGILSILFAFLVFVFAEQLVEVTEMRAKAIYIKMVAAIIALDAISSIPFALLRKQNKALKFAFIKNAGIAINVLLHNNKTITETTYRYFAKFMISLLPFKIWKPILVFKETSESSNILSDDKIVMVFITATF